MNIISKIIDDNCLIIFYNLFWNKNINAVLLFFIFVRNNCLD